MSAKIEDRFKSLQAFSPTVLLSYLDEDDNVEYQLAYYPSIGVFKIHRSDEPESRVDKGLRFPSLSISFKDMSNKDFFRLNPANYSDRIISRMRNEWGKLSKEEKNEFFDNMPINSLYIGETNSL